MGEPIDRSRRLFGRLVKFEEAYPELEDVVIEWTEEGHGVHYYGDRPKEGEFVYRRSIKDGGDLIRCSNSLCRQGGFELSSELSSRASNKEKVKEGYKICLGSEGSPKLRRVYRKCLNGIKYRITFLYKTQEEKHG